MQDVGLKNAPFSEKSTEKNGLGLGLGAELLVTDSNGGCLCCNQLVAIATTEPSQVEHVSGDDGSETRCGPSCIAVGSCVCDTDKNVRSEESSYFSRREV